MVRGIIIGHGEFAKAMIATAEQIVGAQSHIEVVSNKGLSCDSLSERIGMIINRGEKKQTIIFLDLPGGSCTISCYTLLKSNKNLNVVCGLNLPMLIEFFMLREKHPADELVSILIEKGRENIFKLRSKNE